MSHHGTSSGFGVPNSSDNIHKQHATVLLKAGEVMVPTPDRHNMHQKDTTGLQKSSEYIESSENGGLSWLVNHLKQVIVSSSPNKTYQPLLLDMFHIGRFSGCDGWSRLWSTLCVVEFLTRSYRKDIEIAWYPLRSVFSAKSADDPSFKEFIPKYGEWFDFLRREYGQLKSELERNWGIKLCCERVLEQQYRWAKNVLVHFAHICRELSNNSPTITVLYIYSHLRCLTNMLAGVTLQQLKKKENLGLFINTKSLSMLWKKSHTSPFSENKGRGGSSDNDVEEEESLDIGAAEEKGSPLDRSDANENSCHISDVSLESRYEESFSKISKPVPQIIRLEQGSIVSNIEHSSVESTSDDPSSSDEKSKCQDSSKQKNPSTCKDRQEPKGLSDSMANDSTPLFSTQENPSTFKDQLGHKEDSSDIMTNDSTSLLDDDSVGESSHTSQESSSFDENSSMIRTTSSLMTQNVPVTNRLRTKKKKQILGATDENAAKKRKILSSRPRLQRTRTGELNPIHFREDLKITVPSTVVIQEKPGGFDNLEGLNSDTYSEEAKRYGLMFDNMTKRLELGSTKFPMIFVEEFRNDEDEMVKGPVTYRDGKETRVHQIGCDRYLNDSRGVKLSNVTCCNTSEAYVYFFKNANLKPHFVADHREGLNYQKKLVELDIDLQVISKRKLKNPIKILSDLSLVEGLREGNREESDFIFVSSTTKLFHKFYGKDIAKIPFPTTKWMEFFDKKRLSNANQERGFVHGHHDCGWGREGVFGSTHDAQDVDIEFVLAKPKLIGSNEMMATLGPLLDQTTMLMDAVCYENGERLMNNKERDRMFGSLLREKTNSNISRFEAYTIVRQPLGTVAEVKAGNTRFQKTARHVDGPNCNRLSYTTTGIFSFLCVWKDTVFRMSIIMYTRASCGNYEMRNYLTRTLRQKFRDYIVESNGSVHYNDFYLSDSMENFQGAYVEKQRNNHFLLAPPDNDLSETFYERNPDSHWKNFDGMIDNLFWVQFDWEGKLKAPLSIIALPEFFCRYGYVSSFADAINKFINYEQEETPEELKYALLYIALISSSQLQFYFILMELKKEKTAIISKYKAEKANTGNKTDVTLFRRYQQIAEENFTSMTGGPYNRVQAQPDQKLLFKRGEIGDAALRRNLEEIPGIIGRIEKGEYAEETGSLPGTELTMVGPVGSLSCAPLVVFVGLAKSKEAIHTAKHARLNKKVKYYDKLMEFINQHKTEEVNVNYPVANMFRAIAKSWNTTIGSAENGSCAMFRTRKRLDVFFKGQDLYNLDDTSSAVLVKKYGTKEWLEKIFD